MTVSQVGSSTVLKVPALAGKDGLRFGEPPPGEYMGGTGVSYYNAVQGAKSFMASALSR